MRKSIVVLLAIITLLFQGCDFNASLRNDMLEYYSDNDVYVELCATVQAVRYNDYTENTEIDVALLTGMEEFRLSIVDGVSTFEIARFGYEETRISVGDEIQFISAPFYFYNGHDLPIMELRKDGEILLEFEEGKSNYIAWINEEFAP